MEIREGEPRGEGLGRGFEGVLSAEVLAVRGAVGGGRARLGSRRRLGRGDLEGATGPAYGSGRGAYCVDGEADAGGVGEHERGGG